ncbi:MAG: hypothetical protein U0271_03865 [Polyangiaceae bacterium]
MKTRLFLVSACFFIAACSSSSPRQNTPTEPSATQKPQVFEPSVDPSRVSVVVKAGPITVDGDLADWGSLDPIPDQVAESPDPQPISAEPVETPTSKPTPQRLAPASKVGIALTKTGVFIGGLLGNGVRHILRVSLGARRAQLPKAGNRFFPSGEVAGFECEHSWSWGSDGEVIEGGPLPSDVAAQCVEAEANYGAFVDAYTAKFERSVVLDAGGAWLETRDGKVPLEAPVIWKESGSTTAVEAALPLEVMPYLSDAPLEVMRFAVNFPGKGGSTEAEWQWLTLPEPVEYDEGLVMRRLAFHPKDFAPPPVDLFYPTELTYHPSAPNKIQYVRYKGVEIDQYLRVQELEAPLFEPLGKAGAFEVGRVKAPIPGIVVRQPGAAPVLHVDTEYSPLDMNLPVSVFAGARDAAFQVVDVLPQDTSTGGLPRAASWWSLLVKPDGSVEEQLFGLEVPADVEIGNYFYFSEHKMSANADATKLELVAIPYTDGLPDNVALKTVWTWNAKTRKYVSKATKVKSPFASAAP